MRAHPVGQEMGQPGAVEGQEGHPTDPRTIRGPERQRLEDPARIGGGVRRLHLLLLCEQAGGRQDPLTLGPVHALAGVAVTGPAGQQGQDQQPQQLCDRQAACQAPGAHRTSRPVDRSGSDRLVHTIGRTDRSVRPL
ncbi:hypothetical protein SDC9_172272 [bioreactor metagenome]|uniref:Uncharacterized protein n=1 Tax=bioreactor metagenome TaxID=1076179 RepID=A0A645GD88_9ZZZZ